MTKNSNEWAQQLAARVNFLLLERGAPVTVFYTQVHDPELHPDALQTLVVKTDSPVLAECASTFSPLIEPDIEEAARGLVDDFVKARSDAIRRANGERTAREAP